MAAQVQSELAFAVKAPHGLSPRIQGLRDYYFRGVERAWNNEFTCWTTGTTWDVVYDELTSDNPIDLCRYQVANCYMGRIGLINSGGASSGATDLAEAVTTAVVNKRAGGTGLINGRKAFQRPMADGVELLNAIQDVFLCEDVTVA